MRPSERQLPNDEGVSEVIGYLLIFGILAIILVLSMLAFGVIHERAENAVVTLQAESVAQRVAASAVDAALFAERHDAATSSYVHPLPLPAQLEGNDYQVFLDSAPEQVRVVVPRLAISVTAPLFSAAASGDFSVCASSARGGLVSVHFGLSPVTPAVYCLFLD